MAQPVRLLMEKDHAEQLLERAREEEGEINVTFNMPTDAVEREIKTWWPDL